MNCLYSCRKTFSYAQERDDLNRLKKQKPMFEQLMNLSRECMRAHPELKNDVSGAIQCETIHPQTLSKFADYTFHTHPHDIDYPSDTDINTTKNMNKKYLLIGIVPRNRVAVYSNKDGFKKKVAEF